MIRRLPQSLSSRLLVALTIVALLAVCGLGITAYYSERDALMKQVRSELETIVQLKETQLAEWFSERRADLYLVSMNKLNQEYLMALLNSENNPVSQEPYARILRENLLTIRANQPFYRRLEILDVDGRIVVSTDLPRTQQMTTEGSFFHRVLASSSRHAIKDLHTNPETGEIEMVLGLAISLHEIASTVDTNGDMKEDMMGPTERIIGVVTMSIAAEESLFPIFNQWPGDIETGEMMLLRDSGDRYLVLNPLLRDPQSPLSLTIEKRTESAVPIRLAMAGNSGTLLTTDYLGNSVVVAFQIATVMPWSILAKMDQHEAFAPIRSLARQILLVGLISFILAWSLAFVLWRRFSMPLAQLVRATRTVIEGDYSVDLQVKNDDEIGLLARSFDEMIRTLERRQNELQMANRVIADSALTNTRLVKELKSLNVDLETKVAARTKDLSEANQKLTQLDQLKSKFISNVSHELRNPVASLKLYRRLLEKSTDENRSRYIAAIASQIDWLSTLVENILDLTQLEQEVLQPELEFIDLTAIVLEVLSIYEPIIEDTNLELLREVDDSPICIHGSESKIRQMLTNLLTNAVNYTPEGTITIQLYTSKTDAIVIVEDTGIGIEKDDLPHLFERFYRGQNTHELETRGTGLGLGIVNEIVAMHSGHIEVKSQVAVGSRFRVFLPLFQSSQKNQPKEDEQTEGKHQTREDSLSNRRNLTHQTEPHQGQLHSFATSTQLYSTDLEELDR
ncbi:MAG: ATP-binding protein [Chloroflexota bacterium]